MTKIETTHMHNTFFPFVTSCHFFGDQRIKENRFPSPFVNHCHDSPFSRFRRSIISSFADSLSQSSVSHFLHSITINFARHSSAHSVPACRVNTSRTDAVQLFFRREEYKNIRTYKKQGGALHVKVKGNFSSILL